MVKGNPDLACPFMPPPLCRHLFGMERGRKLDEDTYLKRCRFVSGVVMGGGWELKHHLDLLQFDQTFWPNWQALNADFLRNGGFEGPEWPLYVSTDSTLSFVRLKKDGGQVRRMETSKAFYKLGRQQLLGADARKARGKLKNRQRINE
jgi:hypothetical protein